MVPFLERSKRGKRKLGSSLMDLTVHKSRKCLPQESGEWLPGEGPWEGLGSGRWIQTSSWAWQSSISSPSDDDTGVSLFRKRVLFQDKNVSNRKKKKSCTSAQEPGTLRFLINVCLNYYIERAYSVSHLCPALWDLMDGSPPGSSVHGILQVRILEWVAMPSSRGSSQTRDWTQVFHIAGEFFTIWATNCVFRI